MGSEKKQSPPGGAGFAEAQASAGGLQAKNTTVGAFSYSGKLSVMLAATRDPSLMRTDLAVLGVLMEHADRNSGEAFPSVARLVGESGVPKTTTLRALKRLEASGWMRVERRQGAHSTYWLTGPADGTSKESSTGATHGTSPAGGTGAIQSRNRCHPGLRTGSTHGTNPVPHVGPEQREEQQVEQENLSLTADASNVSSFERFWKTYPRSEGKKRAMRLWLSRNLDTIAERIIADVEARCRDAGQWATKELRFIPMASTYLSQERFNDDWKPVPQLLARSAARMPDQEQQADHALARLGVAG